MKYCCILVQNYNMRKRIKEPPPQTTESAIIAHLKANGHFMKWLADKIGVTPNHLFYVLKGNPPGNGKPVTKRPLTQANLDKINEVLKTSFELPDQTNHS
jgi:hypothetical protein